MMHNRHIIFAVVAIDSGLIFFNFAWGATLSSYHTSDWKLDGGQLGLLAAMGFFPYALMQIPGGYLTDRLGARKVMSVAIVVLALGLGVFVSTPNFAMAVVGRAIIGLASGLVILPSLKLLARWFGADEFATIQGKFILFATIGTLLGTLPLAAASESFGWRAPMAVLAGLTGLAGIATWVLVRDAPTDFAPRSMITLDPESQLPENPVHLNRNRLQQAFRAWRSVPTLWVISLIFFASIGSLQAFRSLWAGPFLQHVYGLSVTEIGSILMVLSLAGGVGPILSGYLSDRVLKARRPIVIFAVLMQGILWTVMILTFGHLPLLLLYGILLALSLLSGGVLIAQVIVKELCPPEIFGTVFGFLNGAGFWGIALIQLFGGFLLSTTNPVFVAGKPVYTAAAYSCALSPIIGFMLAAMLLSFKLGETLV